MPRLVREFCRRAAPITARFGFVPTPLHFYFPVPDLADLDRRGVWDRKTALAGIDWNRPRQLALLAELGASFAEECKEWPQNPDPATARYGASAGSFGLASALLLHAVVRRFRPARVIEIGCGWSTVVLQGALRCNTEEPGGDDAARARFRGCDPYPPAWLALRQPFGEIVPEIAQGIALDEFRALRANDILFIDSSHVFGIGSDVAWLVLEVLPLLVPGVIVHFHDIHLPFAYPRDYSARQRWFWNEQFALQAFLANNADFEILLAGFELTTQSIAEFRSAFPAWSPETHGPTSSFWMRRRP